jgi:hypothetical protein
LISAYHIFGLGGIRHHTGPSNMFLNNQWIKEMKSKVRKYLKKYENENTTDENF